MKRFNYQQFYIKFSDGTEEIIYCSSARSGDHTSQRAQFIDWKGCGVNISGYSQYYNRPWGAYRYEKAILALANKLPAVYRNELRAWSEQHIHEEAEKADAFFGEFQQAWNKATPGLRDALAAGGPLETEDQAKSALAVLKMGNFLRSLESAENK